MSDNTGERRDDHRSDRETEEDRGNDTDTREDRIFDFMDAKFSQKLEIIRHSQKPKPEFKYVGDEHQWKFNTEIETDLLLKPEYGK